MKIVFEQTALTAHALNRYMIEMVEIEPCILTGYLNKIFFNKLCKNGCSNYTKKWSCPPHSPDISAFTPKWCKIFVLFMHIDMSRFSYIKNDYLKIKAANSMLKSRADRYLKYMASKYGRYISTGSCRLCKPCKCKIGLPCTHPNIMTYSFEAMGVDVGKLVMDQFQKPLLWYKPHNLPAYTSVVCGLLTNADISVHDMREEYLQYITH